MDLKNIRKSLGLTQQQLADLIRKDRSFIAKIESGKVHPSVKTAKTLGAVLGMEWTKFYED